MVIRILGSPSSNELMQIIAAVGLSQNFGALKSLLPQEFKLDTRENAFIKYIKSK